MKSKKSVESFFDKLFSAIQISLNEAAKIGNLEKRVLVNARKLAHGQGGDTWKQVSRVERSIWALEREEKRQNKAREARARSAPGFLVYPYSTNRNYRKGLENAPRYKF
jgi:hypothetical protein